MKGKISTEGFRSNSPDRNNDFNVIPSNFISMSQVDFPIMGIDNLGNKKMMQPNQQYKFKGSHVYEFPIRQMGGDLPQYQVEENGKVKRSLYNDSVYNFLNKNKNTHSVDVNNFEMFKRNQKENGFQHELGVYDKEVNGRTFLQMGGDAGGLSSEDARQALIDGHIMGNELTSQQRTYFAEIAGTDENGNLLDENGEVVDESNQDQGDEEDVMKKGGNWIPKHLHKGRCTPGSPNYDCPKGSPQWNLAQTFKKHHGFHQRGGEEIENYETNLNNDFFQMGGGRPRLTNDEIIEAAEHNKGYVSPEDYFKFELNYAKDNSVGSRSFVDLNDADRNRIMKMMQYKKEKDIAYPFFQMGGNPMDFSMLTQTDQDLQNKYKNTGINTINAEAFAAHQAAVPVAQNNMRTRTTDTSGNQIITYPGGRREMYNSTGKNKLWESAPEMPMQQNAAVGPAPMNPPAHFEAGGEPCFECGGANMRDGGAFLKTLIKSAYKDVMKKGGQSSPQGMTRDDVLSERKNFFKSYLSNNAMYALAMEEHGTMFNPTENKAQYGGNYYAQQGQEVAFQPANTSEDYWNNQPGYNTQVDGAQGNNGVTTNPMPTFGGNYNYTGNVSPQLDKTNRVSGVKTSQASGMMQDFQKASYDRNPIRNPQQPEQKQPNWFQKNGQGVANGIIAGLNFGASFLDAQNTNVNNKLLKQRTDADSVFQPNNAGSASRGDYDVNSGVYKPNQYVPTQNRGNMKFGGEQEEQYLSESEILKLRKQGHKVIYLD